MLLRRVRWCVELTLAGVLLGALGVVADWPVGIAVRLGLTLKIAAASLAVWELARRRHARARALPLALGYVAALTALVTTTLAAFPSERPVAPAVAVAVVLGTAVLLPWGVWPQAVACVLVGAGYAWLVTTSPASVSFAALATVVIAAAASLVGARLVAATHAAGTVRRWRQRQLAALGRDLAAAVEPDAVVRHVLTYGRRLLDADGVSFSAYDATRRLLRIEGLSDRSGERHWMQGLEIPDDFPMVQTVLAHGELVVPDDDPGTPIKALLEEHGARRVLYVAMRAGGELVGILGLVRNRDVAFTVAERRVARALADQSAVAVRSVRLADELRRAGRLKQQFVATMSHELRTPLTVILGFAEMARDAGPGTDELEDCVGRIETAGRDLLGLIETTLEIGAIDAGHDDVELQPLALPAFWSGLGEACRRLPHADPVTLEWDADVPDLVLVTDQRKLSVVMRNLVGNALKFTERGFVRVTLRHDGDRVVLAVADTGIGVRPEDHATVFEMFRQADGSESRRYEGTGIGLYVARRFVQQLGGTIDLDSTPGQGSTFMVTLPVTVAAKPATPLERAA